MPVASKLMVAAVLATAACATLVVAGSVGAGAGVPSFGQFAASESWSAPVLRGTETAYNLSKPEYGSRQFWGYVPSSYSASTPVPLVFAFHGLGDDCHRFGHETGMVDKAEAAGFILAYPCGTAGGFFGMETAWNAGTCCMEGSKVNDIQFARDIVTFFSDRYSIDANRVFSSGFSNGAFMTETLLCNSSDVFKAGASVAGTTVVYPGNKPGMANCDAEHAAVGALRPALLVHGTLDPVVPWGGDEILGFPDIPTNFARWAQRLHCTGSPVNTWTNYTFSNSVYQTCGDALPDAAAVTVELVKHDGGVHAWPSDPYFDTATYVWEFFSKINA